MTAIHELIEARHRYNLNPMPELADITAHITALEARILGQRLEHVRIASVFLLRTIVDPPLGSVEGGIVRRVAACRQTHCHRRRGGSSTPSRKVSRSTPRSESAPLEDRGGWEPRVDVAGAASDDCRAAALETPQSEFAGRNALAAFDFPSGTLVLTEAGSKRRASLHVLLGEEALRAIESGGVEIFETSLEGFRDRVDARESHAEAGPDRSATDQRRWQRLLGRDPSLCTTVRHRAYPQTQAGRVGATLRGNALHSDLVDVTGCELKLRRASPKK